MRKREGLPWTAQKVAKAPRRRRRACVAGESVLAVVSTTAATTARVVAANVFAGHLGTVPRKAPLLGTEKEIKIKCDSEVVVIRMWEDFVTILVQNCPKIEETRHQNKNDFETKLAGRPAIIDPRSLTRQPSLGVVYFRPFNQKTMGLKIQAPRLG